MQKSRLMRLERGGWAPGEGARWWIISFLLTDGMLVCGSRRRSASGVVVISHSPRSARRNTSCT